MASTPKVRKPKVLKFQEVTLRIGYDANREDPPECWEFSSLIDPCEVAQVELLMAKNVPTPEPSSTKQQRVQDREPDNPGISESNVRPAAGPAKL